MNNEDIFFTGTVVVANLWASTHNEQVFESPEKFNPERFLDENGKFVKPEQKKFSPFSIGMCY